MKEKILAITSYPTKGSTHDKYLVGIASYAKNTIKAIRGAYSSKKSKTKLELEVLAEKLDGEQDYTESRVSVKRIWKRNSFRGFYDLAKYILKEKDAKTVLFEFELSMFGGIIYLLPFPIFLLFLFALRKKIIFVMHQVISDFDEIAPHMNIDSRSFKTDLMSVAVSFFYSYILLIASKIIVFEDGLKEKLSKFGQTRKIIVIPHGVEEFKRIPTKSEARKKLRFGKNNFVVLSFGFFAWYKGTDWLVHAINDIKSKTRKAKNITLVLAGGPNPNHENKEYYQRYIRGIVAEAKKNGIIVTGFVPEKDIPLYFKASDLVVLPYRTFMSSSGPLSITLSFKKPFLLSPKLKDVLENDEMKELLKEAHLKLDDLVFEDFNGDFAKKVIRMKSNPRLVSRVVKFASSAKRERSWGKIGEKYYQELVG